MGWPYDGSLWRDGAKPAQEQYANVAKAISQFEPLIMFADPAVSPSAYRRSQSVSVHGPMLPAP